MQKKNPTEIHVLSICTCPVCTQVLSQRIAINLKQPVKCMSKVCQFLL